MADGRVIIDSLVDDSGVNKGLKKISNHINNFAKKMKSNDFANLSMSIMGIGTAFKAATTAIGAANKAIKDVTDSYKVQIRTETQLKTAVKNSPLMNGESYDNLRNFASELQSMTEYGDEVLLPFITELVNAGRSEQEAMDIMTAATDIAASGMMDLGSAVSSLNMTFQGNTGTLGRQISSIKNLTAEELKAGKAVEILKKQFAGTAAEVAKNVGSTEQLKNAMGDLKEEMGAGWEKALTPIRRWLTEIITNITNAKKEIRETTDAIEQNNKGEGTEETLKKELDILNARREIVREDLKLQKERAAGIGIDKEEEIYYGNIENAMLHYKEQVQETLAVLRELNNEIKPKEDLYNELKKQNDETAEAARKQAKDAEDAAKRQAELNASTENYGKIIKKRDETIATLEREAAAMGTEVDQQAILNAHLAAYLEMAKDPNLRTKTAEHLEQVKELAAAYKVSEEEAGKLADFKDALNNVDVSADLKKSEILKEQLATLEDIEKTVKETALFEAMNDADKEAMLKEYSDKRMALTEQIRKAEEEEAAATKITLEEIINFTNEAIGNIAETINTVTDMARKTNEAETTAAMANLKKQFHDGEITEKEYYKEKEKIEREAAQREYELKMWEWTASLAQIGVSTAQGIVNALAMSGNPYLGIAMSAIIGTLGAAQLSAAIANKPIPPHFANGGIVPGNSYSGDKVIANVNSGEMILNAQQQAALWRTANGQGNGGGTNLNVQIKNYAGNDTKVTPQFTQEGLILTVRKIVTDDLENRRLNSALLTAENTMNGLHYES